MNQLQISFLEYAKIELRGIGFLQDPSSPFRFICPLSNGHLLIKFHFRHGNKFTIYVGISIYCIQELVSKFNNESQGEYKNALTTIGGNLSDFSTKIRFLTDIQKDSYKQVIQEIISEYKTNAYGYFNPLNDISALLNELRNPTKITKRILSSGINQSRLIMLAAYCTNDTSLFNIILIQEDVIYKETIDDISYSIYTSMRDFLKNL